MPDLTAPVVAAGSLARARQPVLDAGAGLTLRPWRLGDAAAVRDAYADPAIQRWHAKRIDDLDEARAVLTGWIGGWAAETSAQWAAEVDGAVAGRIALRELSLREGVGEVAYWVAPHGRGRGVAAAATRALTDWAFGLGLHRLFLLHSTANEPSCRVAERAGYAFEGVQASSVLHADGWHDMHQHARINGRA